MRNINKLTRDDWRMVLAWYEILTGAAGAVMAIWASAQASSSLRGENLGLALTPFALLIIAGTYLLRRDPHGRSLSILLQLFQVFFLSVRGLVWKFAAGLYVSVWYNAARLNLFAGVEATFFAGWRAPDQPLIIGMNLVPLVLAYFLIRLPKSA